MKFLSLKVKSAGILSMLLAFQFSNAQTTQDGVKALDKENYLTARSIFLSLVKANGTDVMNWYYLGNDYCFLGANDSARWAFMQGAAAGPKNPACIVGIGKTYLNENKVADATKYFDQAKSLVNVNKDVNIALYLADAYINSTNPNNDEAVRILKQAENITTKNAELYIELGDAYTPLGKGGDAVNSYERATEIDPTMAKAYSKIGEIWYLAKNYEQSLPSYQKAIATDATFAPAYQGLAELYYSTGQFEKAKDTFTKYLQLADKSDETQYRYAQFLFLTKDYAKAISILNDIMKKDSTKVKMFRIAGYSNYELGNYKDALNNMQTFFKMAKPNEILATDYAYYGKSLRKTGSDSLGIVNLEKAIKMDSTLAVPIYGSIADTLYKAKKYGKAAVYYQKKINSSTQPNIRDYYSLGISYYLDSSYKKSDTAFIHILQISPGWIQAFLFRARSNMKLEKEDSTKGYAIPYYDSVIVKGLVDTVKYRSELMEAYQSLAGINYNMGHRDEAIAYYEKYLTLNPPDAADIKKLIESVKAEEKNGKAPKGTAPKK